MNSTADNRKQGTSLILLSGLLSGVVFYLIAEVLTPKHVANPGDHDVLLANRLGFIYTPIVGLWLGWLQRSWSRAVFGVLAGVVIGFIYMWLCSGRNFLAIMVGFPCLLGGVLAAVAGSNRSEWLAGLGARLGKGLLAGLVLGFVYMFVLNVACSMMMTTADDPDHYTASYIATMWRAGPIALGLSSALFFVLMRWAVGLARVRILVFDDTEPKTNDTKVA
jgi:hypothetical protein